MKKQSSENLIEVAIATTQEAIAELNDKVKNGYVLMKDEVVGIYDLQIKLRELKVLMMKKMRAEGATYKEIGKVFSMSTVNAIYLLN